MIYHGKKTIIHKNYLKIFLNWRFMFYILFYKMYCWQCFLTERSVNTEHVLYRLYSLCKYNTIFFYYKINNVCNNFDFQKNFSKWLWQNLVVVEANAIKGQFFMIIIFVIFCFNEKIVSDKHLPLKALKAFATATLENLGGDSACFMLWMGQ